jgi:hypothetical protein
VEDYEIGNNYTGSKAVLACSYHIPTLGNTIFICGSLDWRIHAAEEDYKGLKPG